MVSPAGFHIIELAPFGVLLTPSDTKVTVEEIDTEVLRTLFRRHQLVVLRGFRAFESADSFSRYCERWGEVSQWPFGTVLELVEHATPKDHIFDNSYVPLHWDGMYRPQVPEYQLFHCVKAPLPDEGGRTTFSHTPLALERASSEQRALWSRIQGSYTRRMEFYDSTTVAPLVSKHPHRDLEVIRYNEPPQSERGSFINPPELEFSGGTDDEIAEAHLSLQEALNHRSVQFAHEWQDDDVVIADNFTLLHGREAFRSHSSRHLRRVHVLSDPPLENPGLKAYR
ncbi:MAG: TauD/TfdA family dioxygenase [Myxococcota bacterium]